MKTLRIYSFNTFPLMPHSSISSSHHVVRNVPSTYFSCYWKFVLLTVSLQFALPSTSHLW